MSAALAYYPEIDWRSVAPDEWAYVGDLIDTPALPGPDPYPSKWEAIRFAEYVRAALPHGLVLAGTADHALRLIELSEALAPKGVPNLLSTEPPPEPWLTIQRELLKFFRIGLGSSTEDGRRDALNMFGETLASKALHRRIAVWNAIPFTTDDEGQRGLDGLAAYAVGIAKKVLADHTSEERKGQPKAIRCLTLREVFNDQGAGLLESHPGSMSPSADTMIRLIDDERGSVLLTEDPDLELFWDEVHAWCGRKFRQRFGRTWRRTSELSPREVAALRVDGRPLTPEEGTWVRLLSVPACPETLDVYSDTSPEAVFKVTYETVKKAFQRAAAKKSTSVSRELASDPRLVP